VKSYWDSITTRRFRRRAGLRAAVVGGVAASLAAAGISCGRHSGGSGTNSGTTSGAQGSAKTPQPGGTLQQMVKDSPPSLDAHQTSSTNSMAIQGRVLSRLFRFKTANDPAVSRDRTIEPDLALSVESPDAITWTVKLKPDVHFHDVAPVNGHLVQAEDVKATFTRLFATPANPYRGILGTYLDPAQIQTPSSDTLVFKLKYPYSPFTKALASTNYGWIFPREALAGSYDPAKTMIGSGPFLFVSYQPDVAVTLKRNPNWYESGRPYVDGVRVAVIPDDANRLAQFVSGHLDVNAFLPTDVPTVKQSVPTAVDNIADPGSGMMLYLQLGDPQAVWQDVRVRRALSMAIDREALGKAVFQSDFEYGFQVGLSFGKWALHMEQLPPDVAQYYKFNPAEAKKLLQAAGVTNPSYKLGYPNPNPVLGTVTSVQTTSAMLNAVSIKTTLVPIDYTSAWLAGGKGARYGNFPSDMITFAGIEGAQDADDYLYNYFGSTSNSNEEHLSDKKLDDMIAKERTIVNDDERAKACIEIEQYMAEQMFTVAFLPQPRVHTLVQGRVQNYLQVSGALGTEQESKLWLQS
jgi:peptide/nickel transport system substrate-binding protein